MPLVPLLPRRAVPAPIIEDNLRKDIEGMHPGSTQPVPIKWDMAAYDNLVHPDGARSTAAELDGNGQLAPWVAAFPQERLLETNIRRQQQLMATVMEDARWQTGNFVVLQPDADATDEFWVGRITRKPWVVQEDGGDMAKLEVQWYVPVRGGNYRGWLHPMLGEKKEPSVEVQDIVCVIAQFEPKVAGQGHRAGYVKVPGAVVSRVANMRGTRADETHDSE